MILPHENDFTQSGTTQFVADLQLPGCDVHLYKTAKSFGAVLTPENVTALLSTWENENLYFLPGVRPGIRARAADSDVLFRGMFTCDFDIRKELEKSGRKVGEPDVATAADEIIAALSGHPVYGKMRYCVHSGNGLHVHYFGEPVAVHKEQWAAGLKTVFAEIAALTPIPPDFGCSNAGRIMRMPGSWNVKDAANRKPVKIITYFAGAQLPPLSFIQERGREAMHKQAEQKAVEKAAFEEKGNELGSGVIDLINSIPIEQVVAQLPLGCHVKCVKKDGGMRFVDEKGIERGFFKHNHYNVIVHEGTSLFPPPSRVGYNCLGLAKVVLGIGTTEAIEWFCARSTRVREAQQEGRTAWTEKRKMNNLSLFFSSVR